MKPVHVLFMITSTPRLTNGKATGLWAEEFVIPYLRCHGAGVRTTLASPAGGAVPIDPRSVDSVEQHPDWQPALAALRHTELLSKLQAATFDALFIPGGHGCMFDLAENSAAARLLAEFHSQHKLIAAVCHGPAALLEARDDRGVPLINGRQLTAFSNSEEQAVGLAGAMPFLLETQLRERGAQYVAGADFQPHTVRDDWLITGQNPASTAAVTELLLTALQR